MGEVIGRLERRGLKLVGCRLMTVSHELAEQHYAALRERPFFPGLIRFITSGPVVAMVWEGARAISLVRSTMGATDPGAAATGSIRADLAVDIGMNVVHGSDGPESAEREISLWFRSEEVMGYSRDIDRWVYETRA